MRDEVPFRASVSAAFEPVDRDGAGIARSSVASARFVVATERARSVSGRSIPRALASSSMVRRCLRRVSIAKLEGAKSLPASRRA